MSESQKETKPEEARTEEAVDETDASVTSKLAEIQAERDEYYDLLLRKQAEFDNFRKRIRREQQENRVSAQVEILKELLLIVDACEKGLESLPADSEDESLQSFRAGYELLLRQLTSLLERYEVLAVPGVGADFDPNLHEAVISEASAQQQEGKILEEYRKGYRIGERLLRAAQVKVAGGTEGE